MYPANFKTKKPQTAAPTSRTPAKEQRQGFKPSPEALKLLPDIIAGMDEGLMVINAQGKKILCNPAARRIMGMSPNGSNGFKCSKTLGLYQTDKITLYSELQLPWIEALSGIVMDAVDIFIRNAAIPEGKWIKVSAKPLINAKGRIIGAMALIKEAALRRETESRLRQQRDELQTILDASPTLIFYKDTENRFIKVNRAYLNTMGCSSRKIEGKSAFELYPGEAGAYWKDDLEVIASGKPKTGIIEPMATKDGMRLMQTAKIPYFDSQGQVRGIIGFAFDVTEAKASEAKIMKLNAELNQRNAELEAANAELEAFSYSVAHDLRTPLRSIQGFSQVLLEDYSDIMDPQGKDFLGRISKATQNMSMLIDKLLELSRLTRCELRLQQTNLSQMAQDIADYLAKEHPESKVQAVITPEIYAPVDERLMKIALFNLIDNAWKFTAGKPAPKIEFGSFEENGATVFFLRDNGVGFDMAYSDLLFAPFHRLHPPFEYPGSGIGLATVQRIIQRHGGRIWAQSQLEQETTFFFTFKNSSKLTMED